MLKSNPNSYQGTNEQRRVHGSEPAIEEALINMLKSPSVLGMFKGKYLVDLQLKAGVIKALGALGTGKSLKILSGYAKDKNAVLSKAACEAMEKLGK